MTNREDKLSRELERCRASIKETKRLIEYHRDILKKQENKESTLAAKLEKQKMASLCEVINKSGYDIDSLRSAVKTGDFSNIVQAKSAAEPKENPAPKAEQEKADEKAEEKAAESKNIIPKKEGEEQS